MIIEFLDNRILLAFNSLADILIGLTPCEMTACELSDQDLVNHFSHEGICYDKLLEYYQIDAHDPKAQQLLNQNINEAIKASMVKSGVENNIPAEVIHELLGLPEDNIQTLKLDDSNWLSENFWQLGKFISTLWVNIATNEYVRACSIDWGTLVHGLGLALGLNLQSSWLSNAALSGSAALSGVAVGNAVNIGLGYLEQTATSDTEKAIESCIHVEYHQNIKLIQCQAVLSQCSELQNYPRLSLLTQLPLDEVTAMCNEYSKCTSDKMHQDKEEL